MRLEDLKLPTPRDDFAAELVKYHNKQPYDAGHILNYLAIVFAQNVAMHGKPDPQDSRAALDQALRLSLKPLIEYVDGIEQALVTYKTTYNAKVKEMEACDKAAQFWKTVSVSIASITVAWCILRAAMYLWPVIDRFLLTGALTGG